MVTSCATWHGGTAVLTVPHRLARTLSLAPSPVLAGILGLIAVSIFSDIMVTLNHDGLSENANRSFKPGGAFTAAVGTGNPFGVRCLFSWTVCV